VVVWDGEGECGCGCLGSVEGVVRVPLVHVGYAAWLLARALCCFRGLGFGGSDMSSLRRSLPCQDMIAVACVSIQLRGCTSQ
jgi:hypothetical protein